jgi:hypothetical protein
VDEAARCQSGKQTVTDATHRASPYRGVLKTILGRVAPFMILRFVLLVAVGEDPGVDHVGHFGDQGQVVAAETRGFLPIGSIFVDSHDRGRKKTTVWALHGPDHGFDPPQADLVDRFDFLGRHDVELSIAGRKRWPAGDAARPAQEGISWCTGVVVRG